MRYYKENSVAFLDGNWIKASEARASLYSQTMHYGFGVFDGMRSYKNADGCNVFKAKQHFQRLIDSAGKLNITIRFTAEELVNIAYKLLAQNNLKTAYIRPLIFLEPNMNLTVEDNAHIFIAAWPWKKYLGYKPVDVMISEYKKAFIDQRAINAKVIGGYTASIMASSQAKQLGYDEALMLDTKGNIAEGPAANFFYEKDGTLFTPRADFAFPGITRQTIFALAREWGIDVVEKDIPMDEVYAADYAFFTGTATEVTPIGTINGEPMKLKWEETQAHSLSLIYLQQVMNDEFQGLTIV